MELSVCFLFRWWNYSISVMLQRWFVPCWALYFIVINKNYKRNVFSMSLISSVILIYRVTETKCIVADSYIFKELFFLRVGVLFLATNTSLLYKTRKKNHYPYQCWWRHHTACYVSIAAFKMENKLTFVMWSYPCQLSKRVILTKNINLTLHIIDSSNLGMELGPTFLRVFTDF